MGWRVGGSRARSTTQTDRVCRINRGRHWLVTNAPTRDGGGTGGEETKSVEQQEEKSGDDEDNPAAKSVRRRSVKISVKMLDISLTTTTRARQGYGVSECDAERSDVSSHVSHSPESLVSNAVHHYSCVVGFKRVCSPLQ